MLSPLSFDLDWTPQQRAVLMRMLGLWMSAQPGGGYTTTLTKFRSDLERGDEIALKARAGLEFAGFHDLLGGASDKLGVRREPMAFPKLKIVDDGRVIQVDAEQIYTMANFDPVLEIFRGAMCATDRREPLVINWDGDWSSGPVIGTTIVRQSGILHRTYEDLISDVIGIEAERVRIGTDIDPGHPIWGYVERLYDIAGEIGFVNTAHRSVMNGDIEAIAATEGRNVDRVSAAFVEEGRVWPTIREFAVAMKSHLPPTDAELVSVAGVGAYHANLDRLEVVERVIAFAEMRVEAEKKAETQPDATTDYPSIYTGPLV